MYQPRMEAYEGSEPYIFISYAHRDADKVWPLLDKLNDSGYRIWYDDGIGAGSEWPAYIEQHLDHCAAVISFITPRAVNSSNCRKEITYALAKQKPFVYVMLEETEMSPKEMRELGRSYESGQGVEQDYVKALEWYTKAAEAGDSNAMFNTGYLYDMGYGTEKDHEKAFEWYSRSADAGNPTGMFMVGQGYYSGYGGVEQSYSKAFEWFRRAADNGDSNSLYYIGMMYRFGQGVTQDSEKAIQWYMRSAEYGFSISMRAIGEMYAKGEGVEQDRDRAEEWYARAAEADRSGQ